MNKKSKQRLILIANTAEAFKKQLLESSGTADGDLRLRHEICLSQRAFFWEEDNKVIITPSLIPSELFEHNCKILKFTNVQNFALTTENIDLSTGILSDENLFENLFNPDTDQFNITISFYALTDELLALLSQIKKKGLKYTVLETNEDITIVQYLDSKKGFREVLTKLSKDNEVIKLPDGYIAYNIESIAEMIWLMFNKGKDCILKASFGESGWGIEQFRAEEYDSINTLKDKIKLIFKSDTIWNFPEYVVEELIDIDTSISGGSPSIELFISDSEVTVTYTCEQVVNQNGEFFGVGVGLNAIDTELEKQLNKIGKVIGNEYQRLGYRGYFDIDFVISMEKIPFAVETNMRRTGGTHVYDIGKQIFGNDLSKWGYLLSHDSQKFDTKYKTMNSLMKKLDLMLYNGVNRKSGIIITLVNLFDSVLGYVVVAQDKEEALTIQEEFRRILSS